MRRSVGMVAAIASITGVLVFGGSAAVAGPPAPEPPSVPSVRIIGDSVELTQTYGIPEGEHTMHGLAVIVSLEITCTVGSDASIVMYSSAWGKRVTSGNLAYQQSDTFFFAPEDFVCTGSPEVYDLIVTAQRDPVHGYSERTWFRAIGYIDQWSDGAQFCHQSTNCTSQGLSGAQNVFRIVDEVPG